MRALAVEVLQPKAGFQHSKVLDTAFRDALAEHFKAKYPTAKHLAKALDLTVDEAKGVLARRTSLRTFEAILKHRNGGWSVLLPVMTAVIGESLDQHISKQRTEHAEQDRRRDALLRGLRAGNDAGVIAGR